MSAPHDDLRCLKSPSRVRYVTSCLTLRLVTLSYQSATTLLSSDVNKVTRYKVKARAKVRPSKTILKTNKIGLKVKAKA